jgi:hypothetical protein
VTYLRFSPWIRAPTLGALICGADPLATSDATFAHAGQELDHLGAVIRGAETCMLGAAVHGAEVRVHFLKSFENGRICEILFEKGKKKQKSRPPRAWILNSLAVLFTRTTSVL